jgi:two-component system phosphate regulon sensor histidine kinase PhoR
MLEYWWRSLTMLAALAFFAGIAAALAGARAGWVVFCLGLLAIIVFHQRQLQRLLTWLDEQGGHVPDDKRVPLPTTNGHWGEVFYLVQRDYQKNMSLSQHAVEERQEMFQVAGALPEGVVILDPDRRIVWLNPSAQRHFGLSPERDRGQYFNYLLREKRLLEWLGRGAAQETLAMASPAAPDRTLSLQLAALPNGRRMLLSHDITELIRVDEMRRDFIANVSHELRTPITVIVGFLEAFADMESPDPQQFKAQIGLMQEQSDRIRGLIDDLLILARLEADPDLGETEIDIASLSQQLRGDALSLSRGRHLITLDLDTEGALRGSHAEIYSACMNLVSNAVRYTPVSGEIALSWDITASGGLRFSVRDTGEGIEAQHLPRLTERFYRVDKGRSRGSGGTGLGLAIVKRVLLRHQARLQVESAVGRGSRFSAIFPAERFTPATIDPAAPLAASPAVA